MHAPRLFVAISLAGVLAACSRPQSQADEELVRVADLALTSAPRAVVSPVELGAMPEAKPEKPVAPSRIRTVARVARPARPAITETPEPQPAEVESPAEETVAVAASPEPEVTQASEPQPAPEQHPTHRGGVGSYPGAADGGVYGPGDGDELRIPGIAGPVIIRGGRGSGWDPCVEHRPRGRGGMGGGILINPRMPTLPSGGGGGGGRFGGRFGGR